MELAFLITLCAVLVLLGAAAATLGLRGLRGTLPRNRYVGVRTPAALRSADGFRLANRVAAPPVLAGAAAAVVAGSLAATLGPGTTGWLVLGVGALGAVALILAGGVLGARAAELLPADSGCSVCAAGAGASTEGSATTGGGCAAAGICSAAGGCAAALGTRDSASSTGTTSPSGR
ncbi:SdpI family protein [Actinopolyspora mortivallis]|uniref:SdpI family protein n=1 Tax=Actinopolyspora mortivallis TaxID=33906 RepID=UPI00038111B5|nr:SdpI family protein [Actinopolyspora mortivallis]